jgi:hypothetical protein
MLGNTFVMNPAALPATTTHAPKAYTIGECNKAFRRITELQKKHPSWTQAKCRRETAREQNVSTIQLRRMLRHVVQS